MCAIISTSTSDLFYRVLDESRINRVLLPDRIRFEKVVFQGVKRGSESSKYENFQYAFGSLPKIFALDCVHSVYTVASGHLLISRTCALVNIQAPTGSHRLRQAPPHVNSLSSMSCMA